MQAEGSGPVAVEIEEYDPAKVYVAGGAGGSLLRVDWAPAERNHRPHSAALPPAFALQVLCTPVGAQPALQLVHNLMWLCSNQPACRFLALTKTACQIA